MADKDTAKIDFGNIIKSSVAKQKLLTIQIINFVAPRQTSEDTVYSIVCFLIAYKKEKDLDIHLLVKDLESGDTMVAEIPSWTCESIQHTSRVNQFKNVEEWFHLNVGIPTPYFTYLKQPIKINLVGVGFFDFLHGQKGMLKNGREIHPVLKIEKY